MSVKWTRSADSGIPITVTQPDDPAYALLQDDFTSTPTVYRRGCYICEDPEFAQMGLPLCKPCTMCSAFAGHKAGHVAADDTVCDECGWDVQDSWFLEQEGIDLFGMDNDPDTA